MKTSQELQLLSSVTLDCQVTKILMNSGSQLTEMKSVCQMSQVTRCSLKVLFKCICHCLCICLPFLNRSCVLITPIKRLKGHKSLRLLFECALKIYLYLSCLLFVNVSEIALLRCSLIVFVFVIVFVIVFFWHRSCLLVTLIKCPKGHKSLGLLF